MKNPFTKREKTLLGIIILWFALTTFGFVQYTKAERIYKSTIEQLKKEYLDLQTSTQTCIRMLGECKQDSLKSLDSGKSVIE